MTTLHYPLAGHMKKRWTPPKVSEASKILDVTAQPPSGSYTMTSYGTVGVGPGTTYYYGTIAPTIKATATTF